MKPPPALGGFAAIWPRALPFGLFIALMAGEPLIQPRLPETFDPRWLYGIRCGVTAIVMAFLWRHYVELRAPAGDGVRVGARGWLLSLAVGLAVFLLWIALDFRPLTVGESSGFDPRVAGQVDLGFALTRLAGAALVVPLMEELFWRSFILRWLEGPRFVDRDPRAVGSTALILSSLVFAAEHHLWFAGLLAGLAYGELYRRTGDLRAAVLAHAVTNAVLGVWILATGSWTLW